MSNSVDPDSICSGSRLFASILNFFLSVMLGNYGKSCISSYSKK